MMKGIVFLVVLIYAMMYMCIYTAAVNYTVLRVVGLDPEIRSKDIIGTQYAHCYVHVCGIDIFLNPFRKYSEEYTTIRDVEGIKNYYPNWGEIFNPLTSDFVKIW